MEVRIQRLDAARVAAREHEGPYEGLANAVEGLVGWLRGQKQAGGAVTTVYFDPAGLQVGMEAATGKEDVGTVKGEVWIPVTDQETEQDESVTVKDVPETDAACVNYTGDPLGIPHMAMALREFLQAQGYRLKEETRVVHLMPDWENPSEWVAEVQVPIRDP